MSDRIFADDELRLQSLSDDVDPATFDADEIAFGCEKRERLNYVRAFLFGCWCQSLHIHPIGCNPLRWFYFRWTTADWPFAVRIVDSLGYSAWIDRAVDAGTAAEFVDCHSIRFDGMIRLNIVAPGSSASGWRGNVLD